MQTYGTVRQNYRFIVSLIIIPGFYVVLQCVKTPHSTLTRSVIPREEKINLSWDFKSRRGISCLSVDGKAFQAVGPEILNDLGP